MKSQNYWRHKLDSAMEDHGFDLGYKLLNSPWSTVKNAEVAVISLNPGIHPEKDPTYNPRLISEERGNSYVVEGEILKQVGGKEKSISKQLFALYDILNVAPHKTLTAPFAPMRTKGWGKKDQTAQQKMVNLKLAREFWSDVLKTNKYLKVIVVIGFEAGDEVSKILRARPIKDVSTGWKKPRGPGFVNVKIYRTANGIPIFVLPHLSSYQIFSNKRARPILEKILKPYAQNEGNTKT